VIIRDMLPRSINTYHEWNVMIYRVLPLSIVALLSSGCLICPTEYTSTNSCPELNRVIGVIGSQSEVEDNADAAYHELFRLPIEESPSAWLNIINSRHVSDRRKIHAFGAFWRRMPRVPVSLRTFVRATNTEGWWSKDTLRTNEVDSGTSLEAYEESLQCGIYSIEMPHCRATSDAHYSVWIAVSRRVSIEELVDCAHGHGSGDLVIVAVAVNIY